MAIQGFIPNFEFKLILFKSLFPLLEETETLFIPQFQYRYLHLIHSHRPITLAFLRFSAFLPLNSSFQEFPSQIVHLKILS